jgi:hypothetical protein
MISLNLSELSHLGFVGAVPLFWAMSNPSGLSAQHGQIGLVLRHQDTIDATVPTHAHRRCGGVFPQRANSL